MVEVRVIGYVRVSTDEQAKEGISLEAQEEKIRAYCLVKSWELLEVVKDEGVSAKNLERPGIKRVLEKVNKKEIDILVVFKLDRLTRSVKDLNFLIELFEKKGISLVSISENLDATTATGRLMLNLLASVSQWEREVIGERTKTVMRYLKENNRVYSRPLFGFDVVDGKLIPNLQEQRVIEEMKQLREQGLSYNRIAEYLRQKGVPTKRGGRWDASTVKKILQNHWEVRDGEVAYSRRGC